MGDSYTKRHEAVMEKGYVVSVIGMNQRSNGLGDRVDRGEIPLVTFTVEVTDVSMYDLYYSASHDTFKEALVDGLDYAEKRDKLK
ncbi:hypothetical protein IMZ31_23685 (plasmid) [Pontibacillus sp. ALD_SL1]|uniref:hypothetical protein n=1 Tax=Pontibacillus sp. ALD_SL1 TaxID=2777185 RepID=UPI001A971D51|nr:hypothetical protein [Pontibacillus sp. ALD_SL1]QST02454.1 hypothetical protein IMZ31_23685 [Pontibacillus sp. ALD_SL1]